MKRQEGFTLIEILLAMGVFLVGVVSILAVFPKAVKQTTESNDDNIAAAFAESMMETLSKGLKDFTGDPDNIVDADDIVWFNIKLNDSEKDYFLLPQLPTPDLTIDKDTQITWYPVLEDPNTGSPVSYRGDFTVADVNTASQYDGFDRSGNGGFVRRMGREALGSSQLVEDLENTEKDLPERLKDFYWCFSVKHEGTTPNLYHFTLYVFHNGVTPTDDTLTTASQVVDSERPQAKGNKFLHKFDFLIGRT